MLDWFIKQQPAVQAAVLSGAAALLGTFIVSLSAFLTAWVKSSADIRVARLNDRRAFRRKTVEAYLALVDERAAGYLRIASLLFKIAKEKKDIALLDPELAKIDTGIGFLTPLSSLGHMTKYWRLRRATERFLENDERVRDTLRTFRADWRPLAEPPDANSKAQFERLRDLLGLLASASNGSIGVYHACESYIYGQSALERAETVLRAPYYTLRRMIKNREAKRRLLPKS